MAVSRPDRTEVRKAVTVVGRKVEGVGRLHLDD